VSTLFTINFRREAYRQEVARRQRRVIKLGAWVAYFGIFAILIGLYVLNGAALGRRAHLLERRTRMIRSQNETGIGSQLNPADLTLIESTAQSTRIWRDRLRRLGALLPPEARLTGLEVNPQNLSDDASRNVLVISGVTRTAPGQDRMQGVMRIVSALQSDSLFKAGYAGVRLTSTRITEDGRVQFQMECR